MTVDLHLHTHYSDGNWSPRQVVEKAIDLKLKYIAITDHDTVSGLKEATQAAAGNLEVIPGIEINTVWAGSDGNREDVHILGYFIDPHSPDLLALLDRQQQARIKLVHDTISMLKPLGIHLTMSSVESFAGKGSLGRPHITQAIVAAGGAADVNQAYKKFMTRTSPHYVNRASVPPQEAVEAITRSGGIASVAHPGKSAQIESIILQLKACGLKAVEAYHRRHSLALIKHYIKFAALNGLAITGGSDCHGPIGEFPPSIGSVLVPLDVVRNLQQLKVRQSTAV